MEITQKKIDKYLAWVFTRWYFWFLFSISLALGLNSFHNLNPFLTIALYITYFLSSLFWFVIIHLIVRQCGKINFKRLR